MSVLILKNIESEGPGTIEDFLLQNGIPYQVIEAYRDRLPSTEDVRMLIMLGGPMSVNEAERYPFIREEETLVKDFISKGRGVLGICLGAQIMAKALGARVYPGVRKEIGWYDIELSGEGIKDPLMNSLAVHPKAGDFWRKFKVFHWHGETFDIPAGAERLARSSLYDNQAFRYGRKAYAFQFHIEVRKETIYEWLKNEPVDKDVLVRETDAFYGDYAGRALNFYRVLLKNLIGEEVIHEKD